MPTLEELRAQMEQEGVADPAERNRRIAETVSTGGLTKALGGAPAPELSGEEAAQRMEERQVLPELRGTQPPELTELTDEEVRQRLTMTPEETIRTQF